MSGAPVRDPPPVGLPGVPEGSGGAAWAPMRTRLDFDGFDAYRAHAPGLPAQLVLRARGEFSATVRRVRGAGLLAVVARTSLAHTVRAMTPDREVFAFVDRSDPPYLLNGLAYPADTMLWIPGHAEIFYRDPGGVPAWSFSFAREEFHEAVRVLRGEERRIGRVPLLLRPPPRILADLRLAMTAALRGPGPVERPLVCSILHGVVTALPGAEEAGPALPPRGRRQEVAEALVALADAAMGQPRPLLEVCAELGVPLRTLNACANLVLGMGAGQYLRRRRLHAVRDALRAGLAGSVTRAATEHGFWELGRFAGEYRALFGEAPSATLRRATGTG